MSVPVPRTYVASEFETATILNGDIRDVHNFLLAPPRCLAYRTAAKSTATATWVLYDMDTELYDPYSAAMHDNSTNNSRIVAQETGLYRVEVQVRWAGTSGGIRALDVRKNAAGSQASGTRVLLRQQDSTGGGQITVMGGSKTEPLTAGDYCELFTRHEQGAALNVDAGAGETFLALIWDKKQ